MEDYYNGKVTECNFKIDWNNEQANALMDEVTEYHNNQMFPSISDLIYLDNELRSIAQNALSGAALSAYAGSVDEMVQKIDKLAAEAQKKLSQIKDIVQNAFRALCIGMGISASLCHPTCGAIVTGACIAAAEVSQLLIDEAIDAASDKVDEISDTAETPEIDASSGMHLSFVFFLSIIHFKNKKKPKKTGHRSEGVDSGDVDTGETYEEVDNAENSEYTSEAGKCYDRFVYKQHYAKNM